MSKENRHQFSLTLTSLTAKFILWWHSLCHDTLAWVGCTVTPRQHWGCVHTGCWSPAAFISHSNHYLWAHQEEMIFIFWRSKLKFKQVSVSIHTCGTRTCKKSGTLCLERPQVPDFLPLRFTTEHPQVSVLPWLLRPKATASTGLGRPLVLAELQLMALFRVLSHPKS